eukprot:10450935-Karenia_brevis.AAC.1
MMIDIVIARNAAWQTANSPNLTSDLHADADAQGDVETDVMDEVLSVVSVSDCSSADQDGTDDSES